jgi:hypothetical protein
MSARGSGSGGGSGSGLVGVLCQISVSSQPSSRGVDQALGIMDTVRREQALIYSLHPAAKKVLATFDREWDGLARHRGFPDIALDNYADVRIMPMVV